MADFECPEDLRYTSDHEWVRVSEDGTVRVGITAYAQDALGDIVFVDLPEVGDDVTAGEGCGEVESTKSVSDLFSPLDGSITAVNDALDGSSELVNTAPYTDGWMFEMTPSDMAAVEALMDAAAYKASLDG